MFFSPCPAAASAAVEADAVVADADDPPAEPLADPDLRALGARVLAHVREPLLDDPEDLDLLVGRKQDRRVDLDVDLQHAVGGQELDVAAQRRVEGSRAARRRQRKHCEARLLLRGRGGLLQLRQRRLERRTGLEHARMRGDGEEVLREAVVDLPRDPRALLGDRTAELGEADRPPDAHEQDSVGEQPEEVALEMKSLD